MAHGGRRIAFAVSIGLMWLGFTTAVARAERTVVRLIDGWRFKQSAVDGAAATAFDDSAWLPVTVPHAFAPVGPPDRRTDYRGEAWYRRPLDIPAAFKGRRIYLRFDAAAMTSEAFVNGQRLGEHRGGFSAFTYDITDAVAYGTPNVLAVRVDSRWNDDVAPLEVSLLHGGIYRDVSLIVTDAVHITPMDYSSPGVYLTQRDVSEKSATVDVKTLVRNTAAAARPVRLRITVVDSDGKAVATQEAAADARAGRTDAWSRTLTIERPHLWNGVADPYLHAVRVDVFDGERQVDSCTQPLGLRYFRVDPKLGFVLNGKPRQIRGVCLHQDYGTLGWAVGDAQRKQDLDILREMGVDGLRLVHYPHAQSALDLYDRAGMLVWCELAQFRLVGKSKAYQDNVREQLREMIRQNCNHPSIVTWSLFNEIASSVKAAAEPVVKDLNDLAHAEDPTRPTTGAASGDTIWNLRDMCANLDLISDNNYAGWYQQAPEDMHGEIEKIDTLYGRRGLSISEYGGGAKVGDHQQNLKAGDVKPRGPFQPEEWQASVHEGNYRAIKNHPQVWAGFVWLAFDSGGLPDARGQIAGGNIKGLVTQDRATRKDAYYFYQANWTTTPMVFLTSRRHTDRTEATTPVKVYSNAERVTLKVNGRDLGAAVPDDLHIFRWPSVTLSPGENVVEVSTPAGLTDRATWTLRAGGR